ncbi:MAG TPA: hypothetical protein VEA69_16720 [Tepidisphaeraceae bacterium]|nr:hypothetical protein [Tepidisphaeraceae bacterium]
MPFEPVAFGNNTDNEWWEYTSTTDENGVGAVRWNAAGTKAYRWVKFDNGAGNVAAVVGNFAYILAVSGASAGETTTVTMDLSDSAEVGAGVFQSVIADGSYGWIQVAGFATLTTALTAGADGDPLTPTGSSDGTLDVTADATSPICAIAIDASAKLVKLVGLI